MAVTDDVCVCACVLRCVRVRVIEVTKVQKQQILLLLDHKSTEKRSGLKVVVCLCKLSILSFNMENLTASLVNETERTLQELEKWRELKKEHVQRTLQQHQLNCAENEENKQQLQAAKEALNTQGNLITELESLRTRTSNLQTENLKASEGKRSWYVHYSCKVIEIQKATKKQEYVMKELTQGVGFYRERLGLRFERVGS